MHVRSRVMQAAGIQKMSAIEAAELANALDEFEQTLAKRWSDRLQDFAEQEGSWLITEHSYAYTQGIRDSADLIKSEGVWG